MDEEFDRTDFEAHVGLPITEEQFEAFKLLYHSGCFTDWTEFARKAQQIVDWLYLPGTEYCLEEERGIWEIVYKHHPLRGVRQEAQEIYLFLDTLTMWHTPKGVIFRNEYVRDYIFDILQHVDGVILRQEGGCVIVELYLSVFAAFCKVLLDTVCHATGRTWREERGNKGGRKCI